MPVSTPRVTKGSVTEREPAYDSADQITGGQIKRLIEIAVSNVPADATKGFAQQLVDGGFLLFLRSGIEKMRHDWVAERSHLKFIAKVEVAASHGGVTLRKQLHGKLDRFHYFGTASAYSISERLFESTQYTNLWFYVPSGPLESARLEEMLGRWRPNHNFLRYCVSVGQVISLLDSGKVAYDGRPYLFFIGWHRTFPLFLKAEIQGVRNKWQLIEECWNEPSSGCDGDSCYIVLANSPFEY